MIVPFENDRGTRFSLMGVDTDCERWNLIDRDTGERADIENG